MDGSGEFDESTTTIHEWLRDIEWLPWHTVNMSAQIDMTTHTSVKWRCDKNAPRR